MISSVPSVEPPSLIICSTATDCDLMELRQVDIVADELSAAVMIEILISGILNFYRSIFLFPSAP